MSKAKKERKYILDWRPEGEGDEGIAQAVLVAAPLYKLPVELPWTWVRFADLQSITRDDSCDLWETFLATCSTSFAYYHWKNGWQLELVADGMAEHLVTLGLDNIYLPAGWVTKYLKKRRSNDSPHRGNRRAGA